MLSRAIRALVRTPSSKTRFSIGHIKNMNEENLRVQLEESQSQPSLITTNRVYKPTYTIEFNREGEVLLYSANPLKNETLYFKYPYILYESLLPIAILNFVLNPLDLAWYINSGFLYSFPFFFHPRIVFMRDLMYYPSKFYLLRGGRVVKIESQSMGNQRYVYWVETRFFKPLTQDKMRFDDRDNANFLTEEGQLKYNLNVESEEVRVLGVTMNDAQLYFRSHGTVHHPQIYEAVMKGYNIDTSDFVINTADNLRYREPNYDQ